jgi:hypothetical protein
MLLSALFLALSGCQGLNFFGSRDDKPGDGGGRDTRIAASVPKPSKYCLRIAPYVFLSDVELNRNQDTFKELEGLRDQVYKELLLPSSDRPVYVYLFEDQKHYERYIQAKYPQLPKRRAFFVADQARPMGGEELMVFTYLSDRIQQDLRHELTHGLLHSVLKGVPLWLDEGLAEYFELPPQKQGVNDSHLNHMRRGTEPFAPDLTRLEPLEKVEQMTPANYRESWAWVHWFLRGNKELRPILLAYLQQLRVTDRPGPLRPKLASVAASPEEDLRRHITGLEFSAPALPTVQR